MKTSTTQLSLKLLRKKDYTVNVTEHWIPCTPAGFKGPLKRKDLFSFIDILAVHDQHGFLAVQTTSYAHIKERIAKISKLSEAQVWLAAGGKIEVHGWEKIGGKHVCKIVKYPVAK